MLSVGVYIYDKTVFILASEKAIDSWIGIMSQGNDAANTAATDTATDFTNNTIYVKNIVVTVTEPTNDNGNQEVDAQITGEFDFVVPFVNDILGSKIELDSDASYIYGSG
jgi:hypothetical protein